jgi:hypothetical protein
VSETFRLTVTRGAVTGVTTATNVRKRTAVIRGKSYGNGTVGSAVMPRVVALLPLGLLIGIIVKLARLLSKRQRHPDSTDRIADDRQLLAAQQKADAEHKARHRLDLIESAETVLRFEAGSWPVSIWL